jgi:hypothetical protein
MSILTNYSITEGYMLKATEGAIDGNVTCCYDRFCVCLQFVEVVVVLEVEVAMSSKLQICIAVGGMK